MLKPQDVFVCLNVLVKGNREWTFRGLADELNMSQSEVHDALKRAEAAGLFSSENRRVLKDPFLTFIDGGLRFVFYTHPGKLVRGMPTAHSAPPLRDKFQQNNDPPFVWPDPEGNTRGQSIQPLYPTVPDAARSNQKLYELLNLLESIRVGRPRERDMAMDELRNRFDANELE